MKKFYFLLIGMGFFSGLNAQVINFPDANFKTKLLSSNSTVLVAYDSAFNRLKIDSNNNGEIEVDEALKVNWLLIDNSNIFDFSGIEKFLNLTVFKCSNNQATTLNISGLSNLISLTCINNKLTQLIASNCTKLNELNIDNNPLSSLDISGCSSFGTLNYFGTSLKELNVTGCINLFTLNIQNNLLTSLDVSTLSSLINFDCSNNKIETLIFGNFSNSLAWINCSRNLITELKISNMPILHDIDCSYNNITSISLANLPMLTTLNCINNQLSSLDLIGTKILDNLYCSNNKIETIDSNPLSTLRRLYCDHNQLKTINASKLSHLEEFNCNNNNIASLFLKNGIYGFNDFSNNPNLEYICADEGLETSFLQKLIDTYGYKNCEINSYCSFNPGGTFFTIKGKSVLDSNKNGCSTSDFGYSNLKFSISDGNLNGNIVSNTSGNYYIPVQKGSYTIIPILENPTYFTVAPTSVNINFPIQTSPFTQDFCITPKGNHQDLEITILPTIPARPGFDVTYRIVYKNKGTIAQSGSVSLSFNDAVLDYVSAVPVINNQFTDKLTWDYINLQSFETREITVTLNVNSPMETPAVNIGDRLSFNALINPVTGDEKPVDNSSALRQSVVGSFDPNDKTCLEGDVITPDLIGEFVNYLIRFENTGTHPAQNIIVKDLIDLTKFDISTLIPIKASHEFVTKISEGNKVEFIFENINLPFDNISNDGYIAFKIKTLPTLVTGDSFTNEANIYFDYNFPILTNKATSTFKTLGTQDFEFADYFTVYPNPVHEILNIGTKNSIEVQSMAVYDVLGQLIIAVPNAQTVSKIDVSKLTTGNYFLKMNTDRGTSSVKFIKN
jgi:Leucine-rich repeat (LRR) protein